MKRMMDLFGALLLLLLSSPLLLLIAVMIQLSMGSPILFRQKRPGLKGESFHIYKFRTMSDKKDDNGNLLPEVLRLTKLGIFLRKYSLDELPQFFNVIKGDLSLVGPRPLLIEYLPLYTTEQARRHDVKPGITGWAQVNGRNAVSWEEKFQLDVWYVDNQSLLLDIKIMLLTIKKVIRKEGMNASGPYVFEEFKGNKPGF